MEIFCQDGVLLSSAPASFMNCINNSGTLLVVEYLNSNRTRFMEWKPNDITIGEWRRYLRCVWNVSRPTVYSRSLLLTAVVSFTLHFEKVVCNDVVRVVPCVRIAKPNVQSFCVSVMILYLILCLQIQMMFKIKNGQSSTRWKGGAAP